MSVVADTHAMIWYVDARRLNYLRQQQRRWMRQRTQAASTYSISAITLVEMRYLVEKNRIKRC